VRDAPIRILVVDDHVVFRKGLISLLSDQPEFEVAGEATNGREAVSKARELMPDIILMDVSMPDMDGLQATRRITQEIPNARIVILSVSDTDESLFEAVKRGAQGYLLKNIEPRALFSALKGVADGEASISRTMAAKVMGEFARQSSWVVSARPAAALSLRETEVLELVAKGKSNKEIASALAITENTVKNHLKNILEKLHLENRVQAATFALRERLLKQPPPKST
jgi:two-component system, NarL family, nitrate/nitrite response regulator NarL